MTEKPTYEELEQLVMELEKEAEKRKQAEEAQQQALTLLQRAEDIGISGCWSLEIQTGREVWSQGEYRIHGLSPDAQPSYDLHLQCVHPEDRERHSRLFKEHLASDKTHFSQEYRIQTQDGEIRYIQANYEIVRDDRSRPLSASGTDKDITERKRAEEKLKKSEESSRELAELLPQPVFEINIEGLFTYSNRSGFETFGYTQEDLEKGVHALELFHPEERERVKQNIQKRLTGIKFEDHEYIGLKKDGTTFPILVYTSPIVREEKTVGVRGIVLDITERKKAEQTLSKSEAEHRSTMNNLLVGVVVHDSDTRVLMSNPAATNILGLTAEQMSGKKAIDPAWNFSHEDLTKMKVEDYPVSKVISTKMPLYDYVVGINRADRDYVTWGNANAVPIFSNDGELEKVIVNFADITERKQAEDELKEHRDHLKELVTERTKDLQKVNEELRAEISERKQAEKERNRLIGELQEALYNIKTLRGLLPICSNCKKIRDDKGYWNQIEGYIERHSEALFSHSLCPECMDKIYGDEDWYKKR